MAVRKEVKPISFSIYPVDIKLTSYSGVLYHSPVKTIFFSREMTICQTGKKVLSAIVNKHRRALKIVWKMDYIILCCICLLWKKRITYVFKKYIINLIIYNKADVKIKKHDFGIFCPYFFLPKKSVMLYLFDPTTQFAKPKLWTNLHIFHCGARAKKNVYS